jgi:starch synthase
MKMLFVSNEVVPFAKVGGLADVAGTLPIALGERGIDARVVMPLHRSCLEHGPFEEVCASMPVTLGAETLEASVLRGSLAGGGTPVYFVRCDPFFDRPQIYGEGGTDYPDAAERYAFFSSAALQIPQATGFQPDVVHANDWMAGLLPLFSGRVKPVYPTLYTIHNLAYQGEYPEDKAGAIGVLWDPEARHKGVINFMAAGVRRATLVSTVSQRYAQEIQTPEFGCGLEALLAERSADLSGVVNGIDYSLWDPASDRAIPAPFSRDDPGGKARCKAALQKDMGLAVDPSIPLMGCVSRLAVQKGLDVLADIIPRALKLPMQFVLLGTGQADLERRYTRLAARHPRAVAVTIGFNDPLARRIYAGSDLFAMPSRYEPCGLGQMISMAYGTVPIVNYTGGLADTVTEEGEAPTGFVHHTVTAPEMLAAFRRASDAYHDRRRWSALVANCLARDFSWADSARKYEELYQAALAKADGE